jgi:6-pyruvoyltetrahydropterin/6-carboxytetrahydropterin synthase
MRPHGHSYRVEVVVKTKELDSRGFAAVDYAEFDPFKAYLDANLDHRDLNDVFDFQTTAENIARHLFGIARSLVGPCVAAVRVSETAKTWVTYEEGP